MAAQNPKYIISNPFYQRHFVWSLLVVKIVVLATCTVWLTISEIPLRRNMSERAIWNNTSIIHRTRFVVTVKVAAKADARKLSGRRCFHLERESGGESRCESNPATQRPRSFPILATYSHQFCRSEDGAWNLAKVTTRLPGSVRNFTNPSSVGGICSLKLKFRGLQFAPLGLQNLYHF